MTNEQVIAFLRKNTVVVASLLVALVIGGILYERSDAGPQAQSQLDSKQAEGDRISANIANSAQLKEQFAALSAANRLIEDRIILPDQLAQNLGYFYRLESDTGTKLAEVREDGVSPPAKGAPKTTYSPVRFNLTVQGDYPSVVDFLRRLENGALYCRIDSCLLRPATPDRSGPVIMNLELELLGKT